MTDKQVKAKEYLIEQARRYSSRLALRDNEKWEQINLATMQFGYCNHCNTCSAGQRDIWNDWQTLIKKWESEK